MRRLTLALIGGGLMATATVTPLAAGGGGGCYEPISESGGSVVNMRNFCFDPAVLYVRRGQAVTWVNRDEFPHVVLGASDVFGRYREFRQGDTATYSFRKPGVYPYQCSYHLGMSGAVVVGQVDRPALSVERLIPPGAASGVELAVSESPVADARPPAPTVQRIVIERRSASSSPWPWLAVAAAGLVVPVVVGTGRRRRRVERGPAA
jgi:plastocyanin